MSNGKGDMPRPFTIDQKTFSNNWERTFKNNVNCEYSGLPSVSSYQESDQTEHKKVNNA